MRGPDTQSAVFEAGQKDRQTTRQSSGRRGSSASPEEQYPSSRLRALFYQQDKASLSIYSNELELSYTQLMQGAANLSGAHSSRAQIVAIYSPGSGCAIGAD